MNSIDCVAVIPAAGHSLRMGSLHKLLMPWGTQSLMERVLSAWLASQVDRVLVVARPDDDGLHQVVRRIPRVDLVIANQAPRDMKHSVEIGLQFVRSYHNSPIDRWLLAPADLPTLTAELINRVIEAGRETTEIVVPTFDRRHGHPVSFPWSLADHVSRLGEDQGINYLLQHHPVVELPLDANEYPQDIDTPEDYRRLRQAMDSGQCP